MNGIESGTYRWINTNPDKNIWVLMDRQKDIVREVGLFHHSEIDYMRIDYALITGLVEHWRPKTNTFHLPTGEAIVTWKDVEYIYRLPINGPPIKGRTFLLANVPIVCIELLAKLHGLSKIPLALQSSLSGKKKIPSIRRRRMRSIRPGLAFFFFLVYGQIFSNSFGARGPAWQLELDLYGVQALYMGSIVPS
ncbi:hypothetical protein AAC387_Pa07g2310 [Persea americana]